MNDQFAIRAQPSARGRQAVSDGNNRRSEKGLNPTGRKDSPSAKPAGLYSRRAGVFRPGIARSVPVPRMIEQLNAYQNARRIDAALSLVNGVFDHIMPRSERPMRVADAALSAISTPPLRLWLLSEVKKAVGCTEFAARCALAYWLLEGEIDVCKPSGTFDAGCSRYYCHREYREEVL